MADDTRRKRLAYAAEQIKETGSAVCVCGQLFLAPEPYVDHVAECEHVARGAGAQGHGDFGRV